MTKDYHKILGVTYNASPEDIKAAYKRLAKQWHPDKWLNDKEKRLQAEEKMKDINEAYDALKNSKSSTNTSSYSWKADKATTSKPKSKYAKDDDIWDVDLETLSKDYFGVKSKQKTDKNKTSKESLWFDSDEITKDFFGI